MNSKYVEIINNAPTIEPQRQYYFMEQVRNIVQDKEKKLGRKLVASVATFGCQMNAHDSEKIIGILKQIGYEITEDKVADFVL